MALFSILLQPAQKFRDECTFDAMFYRGKAPLLRLLFAHFRTHWVPHLGKIKTGMGKDL
jgi:hypothetical protein